jgi:DNA-binding Xre family transcriptional regulator
MYGLDKTAEQKRKEGAELLKKVVVRGMDPEKASKLTEEELKAVTAHRLNRLQDCSTCHR